VLNLKIEAVLPLSLLDRDNLAALLHNNSLLIPANPHLEAIMIPPVTNESLAPLQTNRNGQPDPQELAQGQNTGAPSETLRATPPVEPSAQTETQDTFDLAQGSSSAQEVANRPASDNLSSLDQAQEAARQVLDSFNQEPNQAFQAFGGLNANNVGNLLQSAPA
jgi:hypothetical protein